MHRFPSWAQSEQFNPLLHGVSQNWHIQFSLSNGHGLTASTMISRPQPGQKCQPFSVGPSASKFSMYPHARHRQASCSRSTHSYTALFSLMVYPSRIFFTARSCSRYSDLFCPSQRQPAPTLSVPHVLGTRVQHPPTETRDAVSHTLFPQ